MTAAGARCPHVIGSQLPLFSVAAESARRGRASSLVQADAGIITRIIIKFEGFAGRYLWHCHLLEHSANEMMRPFEVLPHGSSFT